jgi:hypothetical protein
MLWDLFKENIDSRLFTESDPEVLHSSAFLTSLKDTDLESIIVDNTISAQKSRAFSLMSSRKKIRQAPGRLLRQKLANLSGGRSSGNCAFKQPETTDTASNVSQEWNCAFKQPETLDTTLRWSTQEWNCAFKQPETLDTALRGLLCQRMKLDY